MRALRTIASLFRWVLSLLLLTPAAIAADLEWPDRDKLDAKGVEILFARYAQASKKPLGTDQDVESIKKVVVVHMKRASARVNEIRWLSPTLIMAETSWHEAPKAGGTYFYIVEKNKDTWVVKTYYLIEVN
jgi:hypothetical protein